MTNGIFSIGDDNGIRPMTEVPFEAEIELQDLIARNPELVGGDRRPPDQGPGWIVIREKRIPSADAEGSSGWVDLVLIDQDAVPTLVEVKRAQSADVPRKVIGQLLGYAAHASETWSASDLRDAFAYQSDGEGQDPVKRVLDLLESDDDAEEGRFWDRVAINLAARNFRLLLVSDNVPESLARVIQFLNREMDRIEVLAVEIRRFRGNDKQFQTLVHRVIGRTMQEESRSSAQQKFATPEPFIEAIEDEDAQNAARQLINVAKANRCQIKLHTKSVTVIAPCALLDNELVEIARFFAQPGPIWGRAKEFSFGTSAYEDRPEELLRIFREWADNFGGDSIFTDNGSDNMLAWVVTHQDAGSHQNELAQHFGNLIKRLAGSVD